MTTSGRPTRSATRSSSASAPRSRTAAEETAANGGVGSPWACSTRLATILSDARAHASGRAPVYGHAGELEQLLHRAVLAAPAVQGHEGAVDAARGQAPAEVGVGVDRHRLVAEPREGELHPRTRALRDGALQRAAPGEHGDAHRPAYCAVRRLRGPRARASAARSRATSPIRRTPSAIRSSSQAEKLSRMEEEPVTPSR